jgi:LPXTG-site transpeptidase (sortase) family protein
VPVATSQRPGILEIPSIGLEAPVVDGLGTSVLDVAVGHDPATVWPGSQGESVLVAHDVSYFSGLPRVQPGETVIWRIGCEQVDFRVLSATVTTPGATLPTPPSGSGLALVTCWPTNALFWTPDRYVVDATRIATQPLSQPTTNPPQAIVQLNVPAPPALAAEGLTLNRSGVVVGTLAIKGSPLSSFTEGPEPLAILHIALEDYAAAAKTAAAGNQTWWSALALPGVPLPAPWTLASVTDPTLVITGTKVSSVVFTSPAATVTLSVHGKELLVAAVAAGSS